jgi:hypothetical protein
MDDSPLAAPGLAPPSSPASNMGRRGGGQRPRRGCWLLLVLRFDASTGSNAHPEEHVPGAWLDDDVTSCCRVAVCRLSPCRAALRCCATMADRDVLFEVKNALYIGSYQQCIQEAQKRMGGLDANSAVTAKVFMYRAYLAQVRVRVPTSVLPVPHVNICCSESLMWCCLRSLMQAPPSCVQFASSRCFCSGHQIGAPSCRSRVHDIVVDERAFQRGCSVCCSRIARRSCAFTQCGGDACWRDDALAPPELRGCAACCAQGE